jgi:hypothetical protein
VGIEQVTRAIQKFVILDVFWTTRTMKQRVIWRNMKMSDETYTHL